MWLQRCQRRQLLAHRCPLRRVCKDVSCCLALQCSLPALRGRVIVEREGHHGQRPQHVGQGPPRAAGGCAAAPAAAAAADAHFWKQPSKRIHHCAVADIADGRLGAHKRRTHDAQQRTQGALAGCCCC